MPQYYNETTIAALKCQWNSNIVRAAMAVDQGGYLTDPTDQVALVNAAVQAAIDQGMYVIIDWHIEGDSSIYQSQAITFFKQMATKWGSYPNVIYEIWNEPTNQSWSGKHVDL